MYLSRIFWYSFHLWDKCSTVCPHLGAFGYKAQACPVPGPMPAASGHDWLSLSQLPHHLFDSRDQPRKPESGTCTAACGRRQNLHRHGRPQRPEQRQAQFQRGSSPTQSCSRQWSDINLKRDFFRSLILIFFFKETCHPLHEQWFRKVVSINCFMLILTRSKFAYKMRPPTKFATP